MDRFSILKNPDLKPCHSYALTPEERKLKEEEKKFKEQQAQRTPQDVERESIISQYVSTAQGRQQLAASMVNPLRQRFDTGSLARRIFRVDPLPAGAMSIYPREGSNTAYVIGDHGQNVMAIDRGSRIAVPMFEIGSNPQIPLSQIRQRRFALVDRAQDQAYQEIRRIEESNAFQLLDAASRNRNITVTGFDSERIIEDSLRDAFTSIENGRVANAFFNARDYSDVRRHIRGHLDQSSPELLQRSGIIANLWGTQIHVTRHIPVGTIYLVSEPQNVGVLPIQTDLTVLSADNPEQMTLGWSIFEQVGMGCFNPQSVARITISRGTETRPVEAFRRMGFGDIITELIPGPSNGEIPESEILESWVVKNSCNKSVEI
jgi:hypothetical protein